MARHGVDNGQRVETRGEGNEGEVGHIRGGPSHGDFVIASKLTEPVLAPAGEARGGKEAAKVSSEVDAARGEAAHVEGVRGRRVARRGDGDRDDGDACRAQGDGGRNRETVQRDGGRRRVLGHGVEGERGQ